MLWCRKLPSIVPGPALVMVTLGQDRAAARDMAPVSYHDLEGRSAKGLNIFRVATNLKTNSSLAPLIRSTGCGKIANTWPVHNPDAIHYRQSVVEVKQQGERV